MLGLRFNILHNIIFSGFLHFYCWQRGREEHRAMLAPLYHAMLTPLHRAVLAPLRRRMVAAATPLSGTGSITSASHALGLFIAGAGLTAASVTYFVDTRVSKEVVLVREELARVKAGAEGLKVEVDAKCAGLANGVDAKCAGLALGLTKEVDAKNAGLVKEVEARMAGVVAMAASKAEAETLRVFKEYKVRAS